MIFFVSFYLNLCYKTHRNCKLSLKDIKNKEHRVLYRPTYSSFMTIIPFLIFHFSLYVQMFLYILEHSNNAVDVLRTAYFLFSVMAIIYFSSIYSLCFPDCLLIIFVCMLCILYFVSQVLYSKSI